MIVGVTNEDEEKVRATMRKAEMRYGIALTPGSAADERYGVRAVPRAFLIDRQGRLAWAGHPVELTEERIGALLERGG